MQLRDVEEASSTFFLSDLFLVLFGGLCNTSKCYHYATATTIYLPLQIVLPYDIARNGGLLVKLNLQDCQCLPGFTLCSRLIRNARLEEDFNCRGASDNADFSCHEIGCGFPAAEARSGRASTGKGWGHDAKRTATKAAQQNHIGRKSSGDETVPQKEEGSTDEKEDFEGPTEEKKVLPLEGTPAGQKNQHPHNSLEILSGRSRIRSLLWTRKS
eukprot:1690300-Rhodomonas_salina.1